MFALGFTSYWDTYFAGRAAPLGLAAAEVVDALFYNFAPGGLREGAAPPGSRKQARSRRQPERGPAGFRIQMLTQGRRQGMVSRDRKSAAPSSFSTWRSAGRMPLLASS